MGMQTGFRGVRRASAVSASWRSLGLVAAGAVPASSTASLLSDLSEASRSTPGTSRSAQRLRADRARACSPRFRSCCRSGATLRAGCTRAAAARSPGWGMSLYLLGMVLVIQIGAIAATGSPGPVLDSWMSRFREPPDPVFQRLNASIGSTSAWRPTTSSSRGRTCAMLGRGGDAQRRGGGRAPDEGSTEVERSSRSGTFTFDDADEDIHMAIERRLTELVGPVGGKLHTARSRNDQVATDMALFVRDSDRRAQAQLDELMAALLDLAERHADWPMPGYTHLQRAQPVYLSHHLLAYFWMFRRDVDRFACCVRCGGRAAARRGRARGRELGHEPRARRRRARLRRRRARTRSTPSRTATSCSTT